MICNIIVALAQNGAIGRGGTMPWHIPEDLRYFKATTLGHPVVMGYKTFLSLGSKPLPGRLNLVISSRPWPGAPESIALAPSLGEALKLAANEDEEVFVIGGGETYRKALPLADKLYITHIKAVVEDADTFFPLVDPLLWELESQTPADSGGLELSFAVYRRRPFIPDPCPFPENEYIWR